MGAWVRLTTRRMRYMAAQDGPVEAGWTDYGHLSSGTELRRTLVMQRDVGQCA